MWGVCVDPGNIGEVINCEVFEDPKCGCGLRKKLRAASRKFSPNATRSDVFSPNSRHTFLRAGPILSYLGRMPKHIVEAFIRVLRLAKCGCPAEIDRRENFKHIDSTFVLCSNQYGSLVDGKGMYCPLDDRLPFLEITSRRRSLGTSPRCVGVEPEGPRKFRKHFHPMLDNN